MKRLALALCLVFALSSFASAISFSSVTMSVTGYNQWVDGKIGTNTNTDTRVMKLSVSGTGWKALAEYNGAAVLDDWYFSTDEGIFKLELWGLGEDQNADYTTPFGWVNATDDAPSSNWEARLTTTLLGGETVFSIENGTTPVYYAFYKKAFGPTTFGTGYKTNFKHVNTLAAYAIADVAGVAVTGEVAMDTTAGATGDESAFKVGLQGVFDFGLTLKGWWDQKAKTQYIEGTQLMADQLSRYNATYKDVAGTKTITADVKFRAKNDQGITSIFSVNDAWASIATNSWIKNTGWAAGATLTKNVGNNLILALNGFYEFIPAKANALATLNWTKADAATSATYNLWLRGYYKVNAKFTVNPRLYIDQTWVKAGVYVDYLVNKGHITAGTWYDYNISDSTKSVDKVELGWTLSF